MYHEGPSPLTGPQVVESGTTQLSTLGETAKWFPFSSSSACRVSSKTEMKRWVGWFQVKGKGIVSK